ncbi:hypothetical protein EDD36DRAFT_489128 [Exophiala viscosa]|uniref:Amine oxidase n=1 Tax=Exophiala viscosa TaxID=2486360 RepID=A0AAN6IBV1_9EURO|nr:hypothetical protein EDD36DRAFT_489128 [Exophiala viscosa]
MVVDIIVVGGGISGMSAAYDAYKSGKSVIVLEARDRVGGRTYTIDTESGGRSDVGGAWINEFTQPNITKLAKEAGIPIIRQSIHGTAVIERTKNKIQTYEDHGTFELEEGMPEEDRLDEKRVVALLDELCELVDIEEPWKCERAEEFDSISFLGWLNSVGASQATKNGMASFIRCLFALELNDVSFLYTLHYFVCGGGYESLASNDSRGGQYQRMREGSMRVSEYIVTKLPKRSVKLSSPVQAVSQEGDICTVVTRAGAIYTSSAIICTIPSPLYSTITWSPMLPIKKRCYGQRSYMGACTKVVMIYDRPWWREAGYSGLGMSLVGPITQTMDTSDGEWKSSDPTLAPRQYSLSCFPMANFAIEYARLPQEERILSIKQHVARLFPSHAAEAMEPYQVLEQQWLNEEFSAGAPVPVLGCGALTAIGEEWRTPHGRIFFAGTEMATKWKGYMDGAVSAGQQAVADVLKVLPVKKALVNGVNGTH